MHVDAGPLFSWSPGAARRDPKPEKVIKRARPYQLEAIEGGGMYVDTDGVAKPYPGVLAALEQHRSCLLVLFTGGGKSFIAATVAMRRPGRTLVLVHTDTLARQMRGELQEITGRPWELEKADDRAYVNSDLGVVASVQTLAQPHRLNRFPREIFSTLIIDEAHHYTGDFFRRPLEYFSTAKALLLTATPNRTDGVAMGTIADVVAYRMDLAAAIDGGWSTRIDWQALGASVDMKGVKLNDFGEFKPGDFDDAIARQIAPVCKVAVEKCGDRRTIIFLPGVKSAQACAAALNMIRPDCARYVDGTTMDPDIAERIIAAHKAGKFQFLANCRKLTEGYDDPGVTDMIDAAKTKSDLLCIQKVGRVARLWPGLGSIEDTVERRAAIATSPKPKATWWDLAFNGSRIQDLAGPVDVLGGSYSPEERKRAKRNLTKKGGGDVLVALERARAEEAKLRARRAAIAARAAVQLQELGGGDPTKRRRARPEAATVDPNRPPSDKLAGWLRANNVPVPKTHADAVKEMNRERLALSKGWCNHEQRTFLAKYGINGWAKSVATGRKLVAALKANGWRRLSNEQYRAALGRGDAGADG